jgi:hypothetical protein
VTLVALAAILNFAKRNKNVIVDKTTTEFARQGNTT